MDRHRLNDMESQAIICLRAVSAAMIFVCHVVIYYKKPLLQMSAMFFNVGIYIFLIISGFLYSGKCVGKLYPFKTWMWKRYVRVTVPVIIWMIVVIVVNLTQKVHISFWQVLSYVFNLEIVLPPIVGIHHLWFLSVIMICYATLHIIDRKVKPERSGVKDIAFIIAPFGMISMVGVMIGNTDFITYVLCIMAFYIGYFIGFQKDFFKSIKFRMYIFLILLAVLIRIGGGYLLDGSAIYYVVVGFTHSALGLGIFMLILKMDKVIYCFCNPILKKTMNFCANISLEFYIVHYIFVCGTVSLMDVTQSISLNILCICLLSIAVACLLHYISNICIKILLSINRNTK